MQRPSFDSEEEGHVIADEQTQAMAFNQNDQDEYYSGTQEHDQDERNDIQGFVTPNAFIEKDSLVHRKNRFVINNSIKTKGKLQSTQNSVSRKDQLNHLRESPTNSQHNQSKNLAFVTAQKPAIQNLPPSIVLNSKQQKLNSTTSVKGGQQVTNSFVVQSHSTKNKMSFTDTRGNLISNSNKNSPINNRLKYSNFGSYHQNQPLNSTQNVKQSFKSSLTGDSALGGGSQQYTYNTLNQNIKNQIMMKKQQQMEAMRSQALKQQQQFKSQKNMTIKTKCVSLEVSQERDSNSPSSYFTTNIGQNKLQKIKVQEVQKIGKLSQSGTLKIKRKPMISQTMKNSKQGSLNSTPTRPQPVGLKNTLESSNKNEIGPHHYKNMASQGNSRIEVQSPPTNITGSQHNDNHILPDSIHNIQFTRNTQANAKTVSNVAQVLQPVQQTNYESSKKNLSQTKSVALSIENSDANKGQSRISSICTSLTHLNKNINLRMDKKKSSQAIIGDEKLSATRVETIGMQQHAAAFKPVNKGNTTKLKKLKGHISQSEAISPVKQNDIINQISVSPSQLGIKSSHGGVSFTKNKIIGKVNDQSADSSKNITINESLGKKKIGISTNGNKVKLGNTMESQKKNVSQISIHNSGQLNNRLVTNYVSKTAQVSAYVSKENSQNSSVVRGDNLNPMVQHKTLGSRLNQSLKKKHNAEISSDNDQSSLAHTSKLSTSNFHIGTSSMSLKDKQLSLTQKRQNVGMKTPGVFESGSNALKQVTNAHHVSSTKAHMYSTGGSKNLKSSTGQVKKGVGNYKTGSIAGITVLSQSQNFQSMSNTTLKTKQSKKITTSSNKYEIKGKEAYRSANVSSSFTNNQRTGAGGVNSALKMKKKISNMIYQPNTEKKSQRHESDYDISPDQSPHDQAAQIFNSAQNKGIFQQKKQLQPTQVKNSMRGQKESYRRAGFQQIQQSQSPQRFIEENPSNLNPRQQIPSSNPLFSFNDIKEEMKETESQVDLNANQATFNMDPDQIQLTETVKNTIRETPKSSNRKQNHNDTDNSVILQIQEYKKDIQNLKKNILTNFKQNNEMLPSSCHFYRIGRVLGRGAFGKVNLACHKVTEHLVAIKALEKKVLDHEKNTKKRVMQEIAILKQSNHHNVVRLYDSFETNKHICFVMELCQGGDLLSYVRKRRKLKEDNAKYLFKQLIEGLNYIHTQKFVIHRDIKLDNILLDASGKIKICDFGVSKQVKSEKERMYEQCGTPAYIAPEVSDKKKGYKGFKADMWSAGVCLYVMLIGTVPFRASSMKELHEMIKKGKYSLQGEILSNEAKNLLSSLINVNHQKRLSARECLDHPWFKMTQDGKTLMKYDREDLSQVIFTQKEIETIQKDYITRLEKLKKQRLKRDTTQVSPNDKDAYKTQTFQNNTTTMDEDFLFTEHNLDTKEDQKQEILETEKNVQSLFNKQNNKEFQKFEGLIVKKQIVNEYAEDEEKNLSEKSIIFCPFNSSYSEFDEEKPEMFEWPVTVQELLQPKKSKIIKFSKKCRDLNREYEHNNNADLDNGVYNAFVNEQEMEAEKNQKLNISEEDQMPTQSLHESLSSSIGESPRVSFYNSDNDDLYKAGRAPQNSFVQNEISIHESMQRGHEGQCTLNEKTKMNQNKVQVDEKLMNFTIDLFLSSSERPDIGSKIEQNLLHGLLKQELNYLTAAYYLSQKYDKVDE